MSGPDIPAGRNRGNGAGHAVVPGNLGFGPVFTKSNPLDYLFQRICYGRLGADVSTGITVDTEDFVDLMLFVALTGNSIDRTHLCTDSATDTFFQYSKGHSILL